MDKRPCYHCDEPCYDLVLVGDKSFCCNGCKQVYLLLNENNLCNYYNLDKSPGIKAKGKFTSERFGYLDDEATISKLVQFKSNTQVNVVFKLPQIHCSSCIFLLENLHKINDGIITSKSNFQKKEVFIIYNPLLTCLRKIVELLAFIGYEPNISLNDTQKKKPITLTRNQIYKIGVAGFCFSNIMMLSFPEYFSGGSIDIDLKQTFTWLNLTLSLPVLFYSASDILISAWKGLRQKYLNIDTPIALAIIVTFARSYYEIIGGHGAGYLDSGSGIIFFLLIGRWFQSKTYDSLSFDRDYKSYFPLGVTVIQNGNEKNVPVTQLKKGSRIKLRNEEMVPADAVLINGNANINYSFVSGETNPVKKQSGDLIYAGGKQVGSAIELEIIKEVSQSYITNLWNNEIFNSKKNEEKSFIHPWSRYFTLVVFVIALLTILFWLRYDSSRIMPAFTAVLIVACPCSLLLSATFTYGNMLRVFGKNKLYLKNAGVIEGLAKINTIVFDKTGTITDGKSSTVHYQGTPLTSRELMAIKGISAQSVHPLSESITASLTAANIDSLPVERFHELSGRGLDAKVGNINVRMGSADFVTKFGSEIASYDTGTNVHVMVNGVHMGKFTVSNQYREGVPELVERLKGGKLKLYVLSGDNNSQKENLKKIFKTTNLLFNQSPQQKLDFIRNLQDEARNVLVLGDGLNDAGALMQSNVGIAVTDNTSQFSPACDGILDGVNVKSLDRFVAFARSGKSIVRASFILSILYNIVGLSFAVQGTLSPLVAAILMPISSISIVLLVTLLSSLNAYYKGL